jgi:hypothetical protein
MAAAAVLTVGAGIALAAPPPVVAPDALIGNAKPYVGKTIQVKNVECMANPDGAVCFYVHRDKPGALRIIGKPTPNLPPRCKIHACGYDATFTVRTASVKQAGHGLEVAARNLRLTNPR